MLDKQALGTAAHHVGRVKPWHPCPEQLPCWGGKDPDAPARASRTHPGPASEHLKEETLRKRLKVTEEAPGQGQAIRNMWSLGTTL